MKYRSEVDETINDTSRLNRVAVGNNILLSLTLIRRHYYNASGDKMLTLFGFQLENEEGNF